MEKTTSSSGLWTPIKGQTYRHRSTGKDYKVESVDGTTINYSVDGQSRSLPLSDFISQCDNTEKAA